MPRVARFPPRNPAAAAHPSVWRPSRALLELHHDLRRPLDAIGALAADAEGHDGLSGTVRSCLARIAEEAGGLLALCRHVLRGRGPAAATPLGRTARAVAASCRTATGTTVEVSGAEVLVALDEVEVRRALWNLLENAARAAGPHGRVEVTVDAGDGVRLGVGDSGPGFAAGPKGTASLGLAIVGRFASGHGGRVEIGRSRLGGALVTVVLPASAVVRPPEGREPRQTGIRDRLPRGTVVDWTRSGGGGTICDAGVDRRGGSVPSVWGGASMRGPRGVDRSDGADGTASPGIAPVVPASAAEPAAPVDSVDPAGPRQARAVRELHHDLRQPLAAILALVGAAEAQPEVPDMVRACLDRIADETRQMLALCRSVLDRPAPPRPLSIGHLAYAAAESCQAATGCRIEFDIDHVLAEVDEVGLRRSLANLLDNAARAAGPSGRVLVGVRRDGATVRISVADSGPGFAAGPPGTASLGLGIVRRLAREHGGHMETGTSPLGGALVTLVLPAPCIDLASPPGGATDGSAGPAKDGSACLSPS